jgi:hypothetical protein
VDKEIIIFNRILIFLTLIFLSISKVLRPHFFNLLLLFGLFSLHNSVVIGFYFSILFALAFSKIDSIKIAEIQLICLGIIISFWVILIISGVIENGVNYDQYAAQVGELNQDRIRFTLGFGNPNEAAGIIVAFVLLGLLVHYGNSFATIFYLIITYIVYDYTDSRSLIIAPLYFLFCKYLYKFSRSNIFIFKICTLIIIFLPFITTIFSEQIIKILPSLDVLLSYRLIRVSNYLADFSVFNFLFGGVSIPYVAIDNSFALILGLGGVSLSLLLIFLVFKVCLISLKNQLPSHYSFILAFWSYSFFESSILRPELLVGLIFWSLIANRV